MAKKTTEALGVSKWTVGYSPEKDITRLMFEWRDKKPINLALRRKDAIEIAKSILAQLKNPPLKPDQMN